MLVVIYIAILLDCAHISYPFAHILCSFSYIKNRDRLELYALHKQSVSGDAPTSDESSTNSNSSSSVADKAKLTAWRSKRGMSQGDAMSAYIAECDRQLKVYGTRDSTSGSSTPQRSPLRSPMHTSAQQQSSSRSPQRQAAANATAETTNNNTPGTPQNTPHYNNNNGSSSPNNNNNANNDQGVLLCPRGLAAIPLLCAAAAESRSAYLARLQVTAQTNGWWAKQEVLCLEPTNPLSIPEKLTIGTATQIERLSLVVSDYLGDGKAVSILSPRVMQAFLWPVHNIFLCVWICLILTTTYLGSMVMMVQTLLFGAKRTNAPLGRLFMEEVAPCARAVESLCEQHQVIGVRVTGLCLMPLMIICDFTSSLVNRVGILIGSMVFVGLTISGWWYWLCVVPWLSMCGICLAITSGNCFALIELAGN